MADAHSQAELEESNAEIRRLRERLSVGAPTVHRDLSLVSLVPKWSGSETSGSLEEFFASIEGAAQIGRWQESDLIRIAALKLTDAARLFYNGCPELHKEDVTWQQFKGVFSQRFRDIHTDQYNFMQLQTARQRKNESPQEFADRCRALSQKVMCKVSDPVAQRIHRENAERMLLASFVAGLSGTPGKQVRYASPSDMQHALAIALSVQEAEKQERFNETFYARFNNSVRLAARSPSRSRRDDRNSRRSPDAPAVNHLRSQHYRPPQSYNKPLTSAAQALQTKAEIRCYECQGRGHMAKECPTRQKKMFKPSNTPSRRNPNERTRRSRSPGEKPPRVNSWEASRRPKNQGNE
jgi:hypothetical protein